MPRTVVPPQRTRALDSGQGGDRLPDKFAKYVPAETLAFYVPLAAAIGDTSPVLLGFVLVTGLVGTLAWLVINAAKLPNPQKPTPYFYVLAGVAYLCWAIGTSSGAAALFHANPLTASVVLGVGIFLIPLIDTALTELGERRRVH